MQDAQSPQLADLQFTSLLSSYNTRNLTTFVGNEQQVWTAGPGGSADAKLPFTITVQLRIVSRRLVLCAAASARDDSWGNEICCVRVRVCS